MTKSNPYKGGSGIAAKPDGTMTFDKALQLLRKGARLRRCGWPPHHYIRIHGHTYINQQDLIYNLHPTDTLKDDWVRHLGWFDCTETTRVLTQGGKVSRKELPEGEYYYLNDEGRVCYSFTKRPEELTIDFLKATNFFFVED